MKVRSISEAASGSSSEKAVRAEKSNVSCWGWFSLAGAIWGVGFPVAGKAGTLEELQECFKNLLLLYRAAEEKKNPGQELVSRIDEIMGEHLSDLQFSLDDVAAELYISPNYLRQLFKQASGQTFTEHLTEMRMKEAQRLLDDESLKIYEVAERTGYADSRYFSVCYKKYWHITPTDYRRTLQESG